MKKSQSCLLARCQILVKVDIPQWRVFVQYTRQHIGIYQVLNHKLRQLSFSKKLYQVTCDD